MFGFFKKKRKKTAKRGKGPKLTSSASKKMTKPKSGPGRVSPKRDASKRVRGAGKKSRAKKVIRGGLRPSSLWGYFASAFFTLIFFGLLSLVYFMHNLPSIDGLDTIKKQPAITIKTRDGTVIASYGDVYGEYIGYEDFPQTLLQAVLATEDRRFFAHYGIDLIGIARAMLVNIRAGRFVQGGSTITQQVAKNVFLTPERTLSRKIQEMILAFWLESRFSKEEILAIYLNRVYLGAGHFGIDAASRRYFDKPGTELNLLESAVLAGLLKAPSKYSPAANPELAKKRAHQVLLNMVSAGYIEEKMIEPALAEFVPPKSYRDGGTGGARYFTDWVIDELPQYIGNIEGDLVVVTTLDPKLQIQAEKSVNTILEQHGEEKQASQAALLSMTADGAVRAMVGGRDYRKSQFNRAVQAKRQPGSVFKLFVYLAALDAGMTPDTIIDDKPLEIEVGRKTWRPKNFKDEYRGKITMREALTYSVNSVAVQLAMAVGVDRVVNMARRLGIVDIIPTPSIALGAVESSLIDLTSAYAHLANQGRGIQPYGIKAIYSQGGDVLYRRSGSGLWTVLRESVVLKMNNMLINVPLEGTGRGANIGRPMAGKTGTSSDYKDAWFIGFTPELVTGVWVGNDDNSAMKYVTGGNLPAYIWRGFMSNVLSRAVISEIPNDAESDENSLLPWQKEAGTLGEFMNGEEGDGHGYEPSDSFWGRFFSGEEGESSKEKDTVEYEYPSSSRRERLIRRMENR